MHLPRTRAIYHPIANNHQRRANQLHAWTTKRLSAHVSEGVHIIDRPRELSSEKLRKCWYALAYSTNDPHARMLSAAAVAGLDEAVGSGGKAGSETELENVKKGLNAEKHTCLT